MEMERHACLPVMIKRQRRLSVYIGCFSQRVEISLPACSSSLHARALECFPLRIPARIHHAHLARRKVSTVKVDGSIVNMVAIVTGCICPHECRIRRNDRGRQCGMQSWAVKLGARARYRGRCTVAKGSACRSSTVGVGECGVLLGQAP